jgi:hypothetical protein
VDDDRQGVRIHLQREGAHANVGLARRPPWYRRPTGAGAADVRRRGVGACATARIHVPDVHELRRSHWPLLEGIARRRQVPMRVVWAREGRLLPGRLPLLPQLKGLNVQWLRRQLPCKQ